MPFLSNKKQPTAVRTTVICPDGKHECPSSNTCCSLDTADGYGCCPDANAVCCNDGKHCCKQGYACDETNGNCVQRESSVPMLTKTLAMPRNSSSQLKAVVCPNGETECKSGETCCELKSGKWGCCPVSNAVCCGDGIHCCRQHQTCDLSSGTCNNIASIPQMDIATTDDDDRSAVGKDVICPGKKVKCDYLCCRGDGRNKFGYMCCPIQSGICCAGVNFCCSSGQTCDIDGAKTTCKNNDDSAAMFVPATWLDHVEQGGQL